MDLKELYTQFILEESRNNEHRKNLPHCTHSELGHNPSCGDEITIQLEVKDDIIQDAAFSGEGCAISQASTSVMIGLIKGKDLRSAGETVEQFLNLIKKDAEITDERIDTLGDAIVFQNISNMPARVKCAVLAWHTLRTILEQIKNDNT